MMGAQNPEADDGVFRLIRHMSHVEAYRATLHDLQGEWGNLTLLGQLSGTGTDMSATREAFNHLTADLLHHLGAETLKKTVQEMVARAQVAVDIMIRNLFERTADIGFLATDDDIRAYAVHAPDFLRKIEQASNSEREWLQERFNAVSARLSERFQEYVRKYSVYSNIILLDCAGNVLIQLDADNPVTVSRDPLIHEALNTGREYVEAFGPTDLVPGAAQSLIYAYRVTAAENSDPLGVLCLCFRFENETEGIFRNLHGAEDGSVITLLDHSGRVIASSDAWHIPLGAPLERVLDADFRIVLFAGRDYLAVTRPTKGYQGYNGLGWYGHVMVPLDKAFGKDASAMLEGVSPSVLAEVMSNPSLFSEALRNIPLQAERIQSELNLSMWNSNLRLNSESASNPAFAKILLREISNIGLRTKDVFERSIANLHQTVVSAILQDCQFLAALAIDIMDRNLYERANDCRWWALRPYFREMLGKEVLDEEELLTLQAILAHINSLYTVYDNLVLFDQRGRIVAVSNPDYQSLVGRVLSQNWVRQTLHLQDSQSYAVSDFVPTSLYRNRPTYIYGAAVHHASEPGRIVGGIGIVFDAQPQFEAMLRDALPQQGEGDSSEEHFAVFADCTGRVIASTRSDIRPGEVLPLDEQFFVLEQGAGISNIINLNGRYYAVGSRKSKGYREYKGAGDAYVNDVVALIFVPLCLSGGRSGKQFDGSRSHAPLPVTQHGGSAGTEEVATFHVGRYWFGLPSANITEAVEVEGLTAIPGAPPHLRGIFLAEDRVMPVIDLLGLLPEHRGDPAAISRQVVICQLPGGEQLGILIDELGEITELAQERFQPLSSLFVAESALAASAVEVGTESSSSELLLMLDPEKIRQRLLLLGGGGGYGIVARSAPAGEQGARMEIATFEVSSNWFGLHSGDVVTAVEAAALVPVPESTPRFRGYYLYQGRPMPVLDLRRLLAAAQANTSPGANRQVVICNIPGEGLLGIWVDRLGDIASVPRVQLEELSGMLCGASVLSTSVVKHPRLTSLGELLLLLDPLRMSQHLLANGRVADPG